MTVIYQPEIVRAHSHTVASQSNEELFVRHEPVIRFTASCAPPMSIYCLGIRNCIISALHVGWWLVVVDGELSQSTVDSPGAGRAPRLIACGEARASFRDNPRPRNLTC
jgi:hypothetical protein